MNKDENNSLDLLRLYKESLVNLTLDEEAIMKSDESVAMPLMSSFLAGEEIFYLAEDEFVSPFCFLDIPRNTYYPFFFFKVKSEDNKISYDRLLPFVNNACLSMLEDYGLHLDLDFTLEDVPVMFERLDNLLISNMLTEKIRLVPYFFFLSHDIIEYSENFPFLKNYIFGSKDDKKYESLFREVEDKKKESQLQPDSFGFFSRMNRVFQREEIYDGSSVTTKEDSIFESFLVRNISRNCNRRESTLLLFAKEDKDEVLKVLDKHSLLKYVGEERILCYDELADVIRDVMDEENPSEAIGYEMNESKRQQFLSFERKRNESFAELSHFRNPSYLTCFKKESNHILNLDFSSYDELSQKKDEVFFDHLEKLPSVMNSYVSNHPYYGLTSSMDREKYSSLQLLLISLIRLLKQYREIIFNDEDVLKYSLKANTLNEFEYLSECGRLLSQYDGFPRKYFRLQPENESHSITALKKAYQGVSSTYLLLKELCLPSVFELDLKNLVNDYEGKNLFRRLSSRRRISRQIKPMKGASFMTVYRVLKGYLLSKEYLEKILPEYREIYGDNVNAMNGVVQIESSLSYVRKFHAFGNVHPTFSLDHPFIKKAIKDRTFLLGKLKRLEEVDSIYSKIKECMNEYSTYYKDIPSKQLYDMDIDALIEKFDKEKMYTYEDFYEYVSFVNARNEASELLNVIIQRYIRKEWPLSTLKDDFSYSIIHTSYQSGKERFAPYEESFRKYRDGFVSSLPEIEKEKKMEYMNKYQDYLSHMKQDGNVSIVLSYMKQDHLSSLKREEEKMARLLLTKSKFLYLATVEELYHIQMDGYDHVIVLNSHHFSNINLLSSYRVGKKRIFLYHSSDNDKRTQAYHETIINRDNLYNKVIPFSSMPDSFLDYFRNDAVRHGFQLDLTGDSFRYLLHKGNKTYALLPDVLLGPLVDEENIMELALHLSRFEGISLIVLYTFGYLFGDEDVFGVIDGDKKMEVD